MIYELVDLVEYLYAFKGVEYELNDLIVKSGSNVISSNDYSLSYVSEVVIYDFGAASSINIEYLNNINVKIQKSTN